MIPSILSSPKTAFEFKIPTFINNDILLFQKSRFGMNFLFDFYYKLKGRKLQVWFPTLFCWEIVNDFDSDLISVNWYPVNRNFQPDWDLLPKLTENIHVDIFFSVSLFGISTDIDKARKFANDNAAVLFIDETHSIFPSTSPCHEEFLFLSWYKQFPMPNGAVVMLNKNKNLKILDEYENLPLSKSRLPDFIWILKTVFVKLTNRMKYYPDNYNDRLDEDINKPFEITKGISPLSNLVLSDHKFNIRDLKATYKFYEKEVNRLCYEMEFELFNFDETNSHLFGIRFKTNLEATTAFEIFKSNRLPVIKWPNRHYINMIPDEMKDDIINFIDKTIFLCAYYSS